MFPAASGQRGRGCRRPRSSTDSAAAEPHCLFGVREPNMPHRRLKKKIRLSSSGRKGFRWANPPPKSCLYVHLTQSDDSR
eukprot:scaffold496396_cov45-Prasinocladus_malaysianus.AAC.1